MSGSGDRLHQVQSAQECAARVESVVAGQPDELRQTAVVAFERVVGRRDGDQLVHLVVLVRLLSGLDRPIV